MDSSTLVEQQRRVIKGVARQPFDIRQKIWRSLFDTIEEQEIIHILDKNVQAGWTTSSNNIQSVIVDGSGGNALFRPFNDVEFGRSRSEFLGEAIRALKDVTFVCGSQLGFQNFIHNLNSCPDIGSDDVSKMRIKVPVFQGNDFSVLSEWEVVTGPHGLHYHAFGHVRRLVKDIKKLPKGTTIVFHMLRPWRDYLALRGWARELRDPPHGINLEVAIGTDAWNQIPNPDKHISLTVHAIKGVPFRPVGGITFAEAQDLVDHGCRGFRL
ncbi:hypothetical protein B0T11DRAFT_302756 [Plectosphaerella cucumerina]|uniref:Uncharacterized protein n=1 Tax=Plectosphaerella cucumerina TaxID=40658 RepID=A0A8K0T6F7_9PEZI|nr:hypothetical protein B0T11DRAFT_302756 [Plectosphaerella cucumerina]